MWEYLTCSRRRRRLTPLCWPPSSTRRRSLSGTWPATFSTSPNPRWRILILSCLYGGLKIDLKVTTLESSVKVMTSVFEFKPNSIKSTSDPSCFRSSPRRRCLLPRQGQGVREWTLPVTRSQEPRKEPRRVTRPLPVTLLRRPRRRRRWRPRWM